MDFFPCLESVKLLFVGFLRHPFGFNLFLVLFRHRISSFIIFCLAKGL